jgi:hypothetical protein
VIYVELIVSPERRDCRAEWAKLCLCLCGDFACFLALEDWLRPSPSAAECVCLWPELTIELWCNPAGLAQDAQVGLPAHWGYVQAEQAVYMSCVTRCP